MIQESARNPLPVSGFFLFPAVEADVWICRLVSFHKEQNPPGQLRDIYRGGYIVVHALMPIFIFRGKVVVLGEDKGYMLQYSGLGDVIGNAVSSANLPIVIIAFIVAALVRICVGSATVAMTMAAGIISAMPGIADLSPLYLACTTAAVAGGATVCSHFNDSGFWLVKSLVGMDEKTTLKTWTIMETLVGGVGFLVALVISFFA